MEVDISRSLNPVNAAAAIRTAVALQRRAGLKHQHAVEAVADLFQMAPRRVSMWLYDEIINPNAEQCRLIVQRWWRVRDIEIERLRTLADQIEQENERERIALSQFELPLGVVNDTSRQGMGRDASNAVALVARSLDSAARAEAEYRRLRRGLTK